LKTVIITGGSSGIGEALAIQASIKKYNVVIAARNSEKLNLVKSNCESNGAKCLAVVCDVSSEQECENLINLTVQTFGQIDVLINNAGISMRALFTDCNLDVIKSVMDINFWGTVNCTKYALPYILKSKGSIVGVSSISGIVGLPGRTGYCASKFAMHGFLESLRIENYNQKLHVLIACPGYTNSNIRNTALNHLGNSQTESPFDETKLMPAETVAKAIFKAIDKRKQYLLLTIQGKLTVFFSKFFPKFLDKIIYKTVAKEKDSPFK